MSAGLLPRAARRALGLVTATGLLLLASAAGASAVDGTVAGVERTGSGLVVSVDVPPDVDVQLDGVTASIDGTSYDATAEPFDAGDTRVERTTVVAIDTSNSMEGARFAAAQEAARTFLDTVPDDVRVGIVTFNSEVTTELEPTTDRGAAESVLADLQLRQQTQLYSAVVRSIELAGTEGQRSVLVLSDGEDTSGAEPQVVNDAVAAAPGVVVDVVALDQGPEARAKLEQITQPDGEVIDAGAEQLAQVFDQQAEVLARQVAVSIDVPTDAVAGGFDVVVTLPSPQGEVVARASVPDPITSTETADPLSDIPQAAGASGGSGVPGWLMYAGVLLVGAGLLGAALVLVPRGPVTMSVEERVTTYTSSTRGGPDPMQPSKAPEQPLAAQASDALAEVLKRNRGLEDKIAARLEGAGSELKPSEWLLAHFGTFVAVSLVGLLLGRGNVVVGLIAMAAGVVGPWVYLGLKRTRRRKKFNAALPDTLQMMASSLSAGLSLAQAIDTITREGAEPVASAFRRVLVETRIGVSLEDALEGVAARFDSRDFSWVVMAIRIQRQVGGNLASLIETVGGTMREREYMRRQVNALAAEGKLSAIVLSGLPPMFLLYVMLTQPEYAGVLLTDPRGLFILVGGSLWLGVGIFWMSRLVKVEV
ncbi:VWA domain-containing protein [Nocardioides litoris]|uniref:VWA domain-containing protein n=1 Tax=Nocardioides litoris TaxID=1926648 RepID=UPI001476E92A|nr:VWA domain-containing protein [Nocardioides litoris]